MGTDNARRIFICLVLAGVTLLGALEVTLARGGSPMPKPDAPWLSPLQDMDRAIAREDLVSAATARHRAHLAALGERSWDGFLAVGDAALRLGEASGNRGAMEPEARRAYLSALTCARAQHSLDGVLRATESFAYLGDRDVVEQGLRIARDLAGRDPDAQQRVAMLAERWAGGTL